ncbi:MAG TPA: hypothetical protein VE029_06095 [Rhizobacter sp.]|nr:hypothetical protein [Rhizobacter sp.]
MYLVAIAWMYVVLMMAVAEATSSVGSLLGAVVTFLMYGALPLSIVLYIMATPARRRARQRALLQAEVPHAALPQTSPPNPDGGSHAAGDAIAPERKEP